MRKNKVGFNVSEGKNSLALLLTILLCSCSSDKQFDNAMQAYKKSNYLVANKLFDKAIRNHESTQELLFFYKGMCLTELDSAEKSIIFFNKALKEDGSNKAKILYNLGHSYNELDNYNDAFKSFLLASLLDPKLKLVNTNAGISLLNMDKCRESIVYLKKDFASNSYSKTTLLVLSDAYECLAMADSAEYFQRLASRK